MTLNPSSEGRRYSMEQFRYRLYTERKDNLKQLVSKYFQGFTVILAEGYWEGIGEPSAIIELVIEGTLTQVIHIEAVIQDIKIVNEQQSVMVTREPVEVEFK